MDWTRVAEVTVVLIVGLAALLLLGVGTGVFKLPQCSSVDEEAGTRCTAVADRRCRGGNCTLHCRDEKRCAGVCLEESE